MKNLNIGVIGAGMVAQLEHIPNLLKLNRHFTLAGIVDPSPKARKFFSDKGLATFADAQHMLETIKLDAVLIATPDSYHADAIELALSHGLHVFCEKPLCYSVDDADRVQRAQQKAGKVVQMGYMKRHDPAYQLLRSMLPGDGAGLRLISVEVQDPGAEPFNQHQGEMVVADDIASELLHEARQRRERQVAQANRGVALEGTALRGFAGAYCSSLIHDINAVHGLLDAMKLHTGAVTGAAFFAGGAGGQAAVRLLDAQGKTDALWQMMHLTLPQVAQYRERITLYFDTAVYQLTFPSPYLNHFPTELTVSRSIDQHGTSTTHHPGYQEAFIEELLAFWQSVVNGAPVINTVQEARRDLQLIAQLGAVAVTG